MQRSAICVIGVLFLSFATAPAQESATAIITKADRLLRGETQETTYAMTVIHPDWQRTTRMKFWSKGTEKAFIVVLEPAKDKGVTFLKIKTEMWNYIPAINRVIKIPPSMMLQSWMGSDFTNDDLVKESSVVTDYSHQLLAREKLADVETYKIELTPKPEAPVVWGKIIEWIRVGDYVPLLAEYYNERGEKMRKIQFSDIKLMGSRTIPTRMELTLEKKPENKTVLILEDAQFDQPISESVFTMQNLRRAR